jgi:DNA-binding transcriptional ArsR family regulator
MTDLLDRPVEIEDIVAARPEQAGALDDPVRAAVLDIASGEPRSVEEMVSELDTRGFDKAPTTVRHHVNVLRDAGLLAVARLEEAGGGVTKYYAATTRFLHHEEPDGFDEALEDALDLAADEVETLFDRLRDEHGEAIESVARSLRPCEHCRTEHFEEYVLVRLLQRATARALDDASQG